MYKFKFSPTSSQQSIKSLFFVSEILLISKNTRMIKRQIYVLLMLLNILDLVKSDILSLEEKNQHKWNDKARRHLRRKIVTDDPMNVSITMDQDINIQRLSHKKKKSSSESKSKHTNHGSLKSKSRSFSTKATGSSITSKSKAEATIQPAMFPSISPFVPPTNIPTLMPPVSFPLLEPSITPSSFVSFPSNIPSLSNGFVCNGLTESARRDLIRPMLAEISSSIDLVNSNSPQFQAMEWILSIDTVCPSDDNLTQRYILAVFYYATEGNKWSQCSALPDKPCENNDARFLSNASECLWFHVTCNLEQQVFAISLCDNNLEGTIPPEIGFLENLQQIDLDQNKIGGRIPTSIGNLGSLLSIDLDSNKMTGPLPEALFYLSNLTEIDLDRNNFTGTLNTNIGNLTNLNFVQLNDNRLSGQIPSSIGNLSTLGEFCRQ